MNDELNDKSFAKFVDPIVGLMARLVVCFPMMLQTAGRSLVTRVCLFQRGVDRDCDAMPMTRARTERYHK